MGGGGGESLLSFIDHFSVLVTFLVSFLPQLPSLGPTSFSSLVALGISWWLLGMGVPWDVCWCLNVCGWLVRVSTRLCLLLLLGSGVGGGLLRVCCWYILCGISHIHLLLRKEKTKIGYQDPDCVPPNYACPN